MHINGNDRSRASQTRPHHCAESDRAHPKNREVLSGTHFQGVDNRAGTSLYSASQRP